ncbi:MAG: hypothetical protein CFE44_00250 [Burkholderiales bacterium PBB4]|nr:MAG: hypothetical protein CFE44_00250 [Burkholderiales bacterium PBB4]
MRYYILTSGLLFFSLVAVHAFRLVVEGWGPLHHPIFLVTTATSAAMAVWAGFAYRKAKAIP